MLLALDDTDGPEGGCTTHVAWRILDRLRVEAASGRPRLVRLFPSNPWKTRGNAAVVLPLREELDPETVLEAAFDVVRAHARLADGKGAGLALLEHPPPERWYHQGVQGTVELGDARQALDDLGARTRTMGTGRGLIGCLCAAAWRPGPQATYEHIAYRAPDRWGTPRRIEPASVAGVAGAYPETFDCIDPTDDHLAMVPRTPCPVLFGLRATRPGRLAEAAARIEGEAPAVAQAFVTNQASDDHIRSACLTPSIATRPPTTLAGGHVRLATETTDGQMRTLMAFEPTGRLRHAVLDVEPGDRLLPVGALEDGQVNLEKLLHVPARRRRRQRCPSCGGAMGSAGRDAGVRCRGCGHRAPKRYEQPEPAWYEADVSARRHLARPLALGLAPRLQAAAEALIDDGRPHDPVQRAPGPSSPG